MIMKETRKQNPSIVNIKTCLCFINVSILNKITARQTGSQAHYVSTGISGLNYSKKLKISKNSLSLESVYLPIDLGAHLLFT